MNSWIGTGIVGLLLGGLCACSTTKNLPKGEVLYTGIESITVTDREHVREADEVLGKVEEALAYPPLRRKDIHTNPKQPDNHHCLTVFLCQYSKDTLEQKKHWNAQFLIDDRSHVPQL